MGLRMTNISAGGSVTINGKTYTGNNISITGNTVLINGVKQEDVISEPEILITVNGNCGSIELGCGSVTVMGDVEGYVEVTNAEKILIHGTIAGDVKTTNGDVSCAGVMGSVKTVNGDITHR